MKAVRLIQIVIGLAVAGYLLLLHDLNEVNVVMPFLISMPPALVIVAALALGWLLGWLPATVKAIRRGRELRRLRRRVAELEEQDAVYSASEPETPIIPDRRPVETEDPRPYSEHENL